MFVMKTCEVRVKVARYEEDYIIDSASQMQAKRYEEFFTGYNNSRMTKYLLRMSPYHLLWGEVFVCLGVFVPFPMKSFEFDLHSALMAIEQCVVFNVVHLHRHEASVLMVFNGGSKSGASPPPPPFEFFLVCIGKFYLHNTQVIIL